MYKKLNIHFTGIGGVGMSGIAEVLLNLGYPVSGSDLKKTSTTEKLSKKGARFFLGHQAQNIAKANVVVVSSAVKPDNPEVVEAHAKAIPIIQRAEMLSELMRFSKYGIAVSGTHGKTTTTSLIASILETAKKDPTVIIGGKVNHLGSNAKLGKGDFLIAEADESDGSFLKLSPTIAVITNIDREHMDFYKTFDKVKESFLTFAEKIPFYGVAVCCIDHPVVRDLTSKMTKRVATYGFSPDAFYRAENIKVVGGKTRFDLLVSGKKETVIELNLFGNHNVLNALASIAVAREISIPFSQIKKSLSTFQGIGRRCEILFRNKNNIVLDDYGHHPEEIKATLSALRQGYKGRFVTFFQPHRYTRTQDLYEEFLGAFDKTDVLILTDIYAAGESVIPGLSSQKLALDIAKKTGKKVFYLKKSETILEELSKIIRKKDVLVFMGAGDISQLGRDFVKKFCIK